MKQYIKSFLWAAAGIILSVPMLKSQFSPFFWFLLAISILLAIMGLFQFFKSKKN